MGAGARNLMCDSKSGIQAFTCTRASSEAATWGSEIQLGSLRRSLIILESFLETFFGPILLNYPPCSYPPPFMVRSGAGVLFLGSVWIVKAGLGAEISIDNPFISESEAQSDLWGTCVLPSDSPALALFSSTKGKLKACAPTSSHLWKEQGPAVKRPCRIILSNLEIYPIFSVLYQSGRQTLCWCRLKDRGIKSNFTDMGFWNVLPNPSDVPLHQLESRVEFAQGP